MSCPIIWFRKGCQGQIFFFPQEIWWNQLPGLIFEGSWEMLWYSRIKEQDKEVKCLGPGWLSSNLVPVHGSGADSALGGVLWGKSSQNRARILCVLKSKPSGRRLCPTQYLPGSFCSSRQVKQSNWPIIWESFKQGTVRDAEQRGILSVVVVKSLCSLNVLSENREFLIIFHTGLWVYEPMCPLSEYHVQWMECLYLTKKSRYAERKANLMVDNAHI